MPSVKIPNGSGGWIKLPTVKGDAGKITSVVLTSGNHAAGTTDTYTITYNDNSTTTFTVYNGADGEGAVASVTGTLPIVSTGGNDPVISINAATTSAAGSMSAEDKAKLDGIATGAEVNVNADWNASSGDAQILNKPTTMTPSPHAHGNITNDGKIGSTANLMVVTGTSGAVTTKSVADTLTLLGLSGAAKIETTSYTGTGTYGSDNPQSITSNGTPYLIIVLNGSYGARGVFFPQTLTTSYANYGWGNGWESTNGDYAKKSSDGKTVYWYSTLGAASDQLNQTGIVYTVIKFTL